MDWNTLLGGRAATSPVRPKKPKSVARRANSAIRKVRIQVGSVSAEITFKKVKNIRLTIRPPFGDVAISAPVRMPLSPIRAFVESKLDWIEDHQRKIRSRKVPKPIQYESGDILYVWGQAYPLKVIEKRGKATVEVTDSLLILTIRPRADSTQREKAVQKWLREVFTEAIDSLFQEWEPKMNVKARSFSIRQMKTRWGSCNTRAHTIRLNTELVKRPIECLEYVVVHELVHLLERSHNARFKGFMDLYLPTWREIQKRLNQPLPDGTSGMERVSGPESSGSVD